jgi:hypothetical protein
VYFIEGKYLSYTFYFTRMQFDQELEATFEWFERMETSDKEELVVPSSAEVGAAVSSSPSIEALVASFEAVEKELGGGGTGREFDDLPIGRCNGDNECEGVDLDELYPSISVLQQQDRLNNARGRVSRAAQAEVAVVVAAAEQQQQQQQEQMAALDVAVAAIDNDMGYGGIVADEGYVSDNDSIHLLPLHVPLPPAYFEQQPQHIPGIFAV